MLSMPLADALKPLPAGAVGPGGGTQQGRARRMRVWPASSSWTLPRTPGNRLNPSFLSNPLGFSQPDRTIVPSAYSWTSSFPDLMDQATHNKTVSFIWGIADDVLRDLFRRGGYPDVILPMCVLRRLDAVLAPTKQAVLDACKMLDELFH